MLSLSLPSLVEVEASQLPTLLDLYLDETQKRVRPSSFKVTYRYIAPFQDWWSNHPYVHQNTLSKKTIAEFMEWYLHEYKPERVPKTTEYMAHFMSETLRTFLRWLHQKGAVQENIVEICPLYEYTPPNDKYFPTINDLLAMFHICRGPNRIRDAALLSFMVETGARRFEVAAVHVKHVTLDMPLNDFSIDPENFGHVYLPVTKGNHDGEKPGRTSVFSHMTALLLKTYLHSHGVTSGSLFGMPAGSIWYVTNKIGAAANLPRIHPHAFRAMFIDWFVDNSDGAEGIKADLALRLQVGHQTRKDVTVAHYVDHANSAKNIRRIRSFYTSPMLHLESRGDWDWSKWLQ